jgi:hypothetical protein
MIYAFEQYLLENGRARLLFRVWFAIKYRTEIGLLLRFYKNWSVIDEGLHTWDVFRIFLKTYGWRSDKFVHIVYVCFFLDKLELVDPYDNMMIRLKRKRPFFSFTLNKKEVSHV